MRKKERIIGSLVILFVIVTAGIFIFSFREAEEFSGEEVISMFSESGDNSKKQTQENSSDKNNDENKEEQTSTNIVAEIKGEVKNPNVYKLREGSRINDLIEVAGGLTEMANIDSVNRASIISDGDCIIIYNINDENQESEVLQTNVSQGASNDKSDLININTANIDQLKTITGIGDSKAEAIIEYREKTGKFNSVDDLTNVTGIGEKTLEKIKDKLSV